MYISFFVDSILFDRYNNSDYKISTKLEQYASLRVILSQRQRVEESFRCRKLL